jgi:hypothetical protein
LTFSQPYFFILVIFISISFFFLVSIIYCFNIFYWSDVQNVPKEDVVTL